MAHTSTLHDYRFRDQADDVRGAEVYGRNDDKLGVIDDVIIDHADGLIKYAVVDTGGWLRHRKFMVPAHVIHPYARHEDHFAVDLTRKQVESFPAYDAKAFDSEENWNRYEQQFRNHWESQGNVAHQAGSDHNVTPPAAETPVEAGSIAAGNTRGYVPNFTPERIESPTKLPGGPSYMLHQQEDTATSHATAPWSSQARWQQFQGSIRRHLPEILRECKTCGPDQKMQSRDAMTREPEELDKAG
ncbi:MAG: PRC-barrel domain-containing protein [Acidobacteria bacterium]|nr:PRC-barrel domain-containing protein [Acidobacteriota bacterium]